MSDGMDVIRNREETAEWFAGAEPDTSERESYPIEARRQRLIEVEPTVRRDAEERGHRLHVALSFTQVGKGGIGSWIMCKRCGEHLEIEVDDTLKVEVSGGPTLNECQPPTS